jgi:hypothetical protein
MSQTVAEPGTGTVNITVTTPAGTTTATQQFTYSHVIVTG